MQSFKSQGKLLITGEYAVLDGVKSLALPTEAGQSFTVSKHDNPELIWTSYDYDGDIWFKACFEIQESELIIKTSNDIDLAQGVISILHEAFALSKSDLKNLEFISITTKLDFNRLWGLGSSSTLISNISQWLHVNPYELLRRTFGGSGYDIACAIADTPILYSLKSNSTPIIEQVQLNWPFTQNLYFVYLNIKQNSRKGIARYKDKGSLTETIKLQLNNITEKILVTANLNEFNTLLQSHDELIESLIGMTPVQQELFSDFDGYVKSLGAWGGDFVLVSSESDPSNYFKQKGYNTIVTYDDMIKKSAL